jgi:hypothetical protein
MDLSIDRNRQRKEKPQMNYYEALRTLIAGHGIRLGDTVIVDHKPSTCECVGWTINWCSSMDAYIGVEGTVFELGKNNGVSVTFPSSESFNFPVFCLRTTNGAESKMNKAYETLQKMSSLRLGDLVQIIRSNEQSELGCACHSSDFSPTKKEAVENNAIGEIIKMNSRSVRVKFGKCDWSFPYFTLKKIEPKLEQLTTKYFSDGKDITNAINKMGLKQIEKSIKKNKKNIKQYKKNIVDITIPAAKLGEGEAVPVVENRTLMDLFGDEELINVLQREDLVN